MAFESEQREFRHMLNGIEFGSMSASDSMHLIEQSDPVMVYFMFAWLRAKYAGHSAVDGVVGRIVDICRDYPAATRMMKQGEKDSLVPWFEETYDYRELDTDEFVRIVVEKLEG